MTKLEQLKAMAEDILAKDAAAALHPASAEREAAIARQIVEIIDAEETDEDAEEDSDDASA